MLFISSRAKARSLAVMALAAVPLVAPVAANAAVGGANPLVTTATPNLRSATIQNVNTTNQTQDVEYCFDKAIGSQPQSALLRIGDYDQGELVADSVVQSSAQCARATYSNSGDIDIPQFTYGTADGTINGNGGAVINANGNRSNLPDSTALAGSTSNAGTRGVTTAPDLTGITVNNATSRITYTFDQKVFAANADPTTGALGGPATDFQFQNQNGDTVTGVAVVAGQGTNTLVVAFPAGTAATAPGNGVGQGPGNGTNVAGAVRGTVGPGAVVSVAHQIDASPRFQSAARPGQAGNTNIPDLQSATVSASGASITFVFDENLTAGSTCDNLAVISSDGVANPTGALVTPAVGAVSQNTITCAIPGGNQTNEFFVKASANQDAVTANAPTGNQPGDGSTSTPGSAPVGGNAGGQSAGFTTAPEAVSVSFAAATNTATVIFDQRVTNVQAGGFGLVDNTGAVAVGTANGASVVTDQSTPQRTQVQVTFPNGVSGARGLIILNGAVQSTLGFGTGNGASGIFGPNANDSSNVVQALSPVGTTVR